MTKQQKEKLFYLTQYADNMCSGEQLFERIDNRTTYYDTILDLELFIEIAEMMPMIPDAINQKIFDKMLLATDDSDLLLIIDLLEAIKASMTPSRAAVITSGMMKELKPLSILEKAKKST